MLINARQRGFTIVELLIVIVVIAILAAITIVAYNGIQERAKNSQTTSALTAWMKALELYKIDNERYPGGWVCLGEGYKYCVSGNDTSGTAQCRQDTGSYTVNATFNTHMEPYIKGSLPTPAFVTAVNNTGHWRRGLMYAYGGGDGTLVYIDATYAGALSNCPVANGTSATRRTVWGDNTYCGYDIGRTTP
ncbi:prepilin-type N-terminal cleavage/methylation domain-containing protein [Candidatus Saccharibacteria bacterium]|nr:prepilin-type N-terminal cleavage/methylation domain-containing protein [Candidatus Saccharibacteria bacterium]